MKLVTPELMDKKVSMLRLLGFGQPGTGKTWFGASAALDPISSPVLFLDYRSQIATLAKNPVFRQAIDDHRLNILQLEEYDELNKVWAWLAGTKAPVLDDLFKGERPKTVVLDSITELQKRQVLKLSGNNPDDFKASVSPAEIQHWGQILNMFSLLSSTFYKENIPFHVVFMGLEDIEYRPKTDTRGREVLGQEPAGYRVALQGASRDQVPAYAYTVMRLERAPKGLKSNGEPVYNFGYTEQGMACVKDQVGVFPARIPNPTIPMFVKMLGNKKEVVKPEE